MAASSEAPGRILVVDDDAAVRLSISALLEEDFEVQVAEDVAAAESALDAQQFDVVLSDFEMPGESGISFLRRMTASRPWLMGLLVTGHVDHPEVRRAEAESAVVRVICKPYDPQRLIKWVENTVRLARMRRAMSRLSTRRPQ